MSCVDGEVECWCLEEEEEGKRVRARGLRICWGVGPFVVVLSSLMLFFKRPSQTMLLRVIVPSLADPTQCFRGDSSLVFASSSSS